MRLGNVLPGNFLQCLEPILLGRSTLATALQIKLIRPASNQFFRHMPVVFGWWDRILRNFSFRRARSNIGHSLGRRQRQGSVEIGRLGLASTLFRRLFLGTYFQGLGSNGGSRRHRLRHIRTIPADGFGLAAPFFRRFLSLFIPCCFRHRNVTPMAQNHSGLRSTIAAASVFFNYSEFWRYLGFKTALIHNFQQLGTQVCNWAELRFQFFNLRCPIWVWVAAIGQLKELRGSSPRICN